MISWDKVFFEPKLMSQTTFFLKTIDSIFNSLTFNNRRNLVHRRSKLLSKSHSHREDSSTQFNVHNLLFWENCCLRHQFYFKWNAFSQESILYLKTSFLTQKTDRTKQQAKESSFLSLKSDFCLKRQNLELPFKTVLFQLAKTRLFKQKVHFLAWFWRNLHFWEKLRSWKWQSVHLETLKRVKTNVD